MVTQVLTLDTENHNIRQYSLREERSVTTLKTAAKETIKLLIGKK